MQLGISTASFFRKILTESCFAKLAEMGVKNTEVFLSSYSETDPGFADALAEKKGDINVHSIHALAIQFEEQLFSKAQRVRDDAESYFRRALYVGNVLGARYYTFHGPLVLIKSIEQMPIERYAEIMNGLADIADNYGMFVAQENVHYCYSNNPEFFKMLLRLCPKIKTTLDIKHALISGYDPIAFLDAMGDRLVTVHAVDVDKEGAPRLPGKGRYNFERLFKEIEARKQIINPAVLIEGYARNFSSIDELEESYEYLHKILSK